METADVKRHITRAIEQAKRRAGERRTRDDEAAKTFEAFLTRTAVPLFRQAANILKAEGYPFTVMTPSGGVRMTSDRLPDD